MRIARAILSLAALVVVLAGASALGAPPPETSGGEPALPATAPANADRCPGADVGPAVDTAMSPETALGSEAATLDDPCDAAGGDPSAEALTQVACDQAMYGGPFPSPTPEKLWCADIYDGDCFAGCCGPRGRVRQWAACCHAAGGACAEECQTTCAQKYCTQGPR